MGCGLGLGGRGLVKALKAAIPSSSVKAAKSLWGGNANSNNWKEWTITNPEKTVHHPKFKNIHKDSNTGNWWSKDTAGHGESKWKIFRETKKGLEWVADADKHGNFMPGKHKGDIGKFIPWKEISKVK